MKASDLFIKSLEAEDDDCLFGGILFLFRNMSIEKMVVINMKGQE